SPMSCRVSLCTTRTTSEIYALSLHDALPICPRARLGLAGEHADGLAVEVDHDVAELRRLGVAPAEVVEALPVDLVDRGGQLQVLSLAERSVDEGAADRGLAEGVHEGVFRRSS